MDGSLTSADCTTVLPGTPVLKVLVFDIDGTLTTTNKVDGKSFRAAVRAVLPEAEVSSFWGFTEFTDTAILREMCVASVGWTPAIATGGWRRSARLKLVAAAIPTRGVPMATSSEEERRVDIIRLAVSQATSGTEASEVVYVGDGIWDVRACRDLSIGFVGRSSRDTQGRLIDEGAKATIPDFSEPGILTQLLGDSESLRPLAGAE